MIVAVKTKNSFPAQDAFVPIVEEVTPAIAWTRHLASCWACHGVASGKRHTYCSDGNLMYERSLRGN